MYLRTRQAVLSHRKKKSLLTVKDSLADSGRSSKSSSSFNLTNTALEESGNNSTLLSEDLELPEEGIVCDGTVMYSLSRLTSPYLYPCMFQYSVLCTAVLITMWRRVSSSLVTRDTSDRDHSLSSCHRQMINCNGSHAGLFSGVFIVVITIVSLILTFVLSSSSNESPYDLSSLVTSSSSILIYSLALAATLIGTCQIRSLVYDHSVSNFLNKLLLILSQSGILLSSVGSAMFCDVQ